LNWRRSGGTFIKVLLQLNRQPDGFQALIPVQPSGTTIEYFLSAKDVAGKQTRVPYHAPVNVYSFSVR
jgi:hypothetical protein